MKLKNLSKSDVKWIQRLYASKEKREDIQKTIAKKFGITERTVRDWAKKLEITDKPTTDFVQAQKKVLQDRQYYIVTWGQNSTPVHKGFFRNIEVYAEHLGAEISVIAGRYKNPTSVFPDSDLEVWREEIRPYLDASRHTIGKYMEILSDIKTQPTAKLPLSSFEGVSGQRSCVIGHPRVHMKVVPALNGYRQKMMFTTGACTVSNYTDSKAGKIGNFHHTLGFVIIEIDKDDEVYVRQVTADEKTGAFTDLKNYVSGGQITEAKRAEAIVFGDIHVGDHDPACIDSTLRICQILKPKVVVLHDLLNGHSVNRHEDKNPFAKFTKLKNSRHTLKGEIEEVVEFTETLSEAMPYVEDIVVVNSNHDAWIEAYLINSDWKKDIPNALEYMKYSTYLLNGLAPKGIFAKIVQDEIGDLTTLGLDESYRIKDWEFGVHGHEGTNGSRGNPNQFKKLSTKMITGHTHSPSRIDGVVTVGTSTYLRVGYNTGASGWLQSHAILNADGKVQQIHCINHKFTTLL